VLALLTGLTQTARAQVAFNITPSSISNTYSGNITLQVTGLTNGETVVVQKFLDANTNGVIDSGDSLWQQFNLTDGTNFVIGGVTNNNVPGDLNSATGAITAALNFQSDWLQTFGGQYGFVLSSPAGHFPPITNFFTVTNFPYAQKFTGTVVSNGVAVPNAVILLLPSSKHGNPVGGAVANNSGICTLPAPAGSYQMIPFKPNFVASDATAPVLVLSNNATLNTNLNLIAATETISGKIVDTNNPSIGLPGLLVMVATKDKSFAGICFTDTNGNFTQGVISNLWQIGGNSGDYALHGYLEFQYKVQVAATNGSVSGVTIAVPKATALFFGTVRDYFGNPIPGVAIESDDNNDYYEADGFSDTNGNYVGIALGGLNNDQWKVQQDYGGPSGYFYSQGTNNVTLNSGQVFNYNFTGISTTNYISGNVKYNGTNVIGVGVNASATINGVNYSLNNVDTDTNGNYLLNVGNGTWSVGVSQSGGNDSLNNILGSGNYQSPNNVNVAITNDNGTADFAIQSCNGVQIITTNLPVGFVSAPYDQFLQASSCNNNFTWSLNSGALPPGLQLDSFGELFGTPGTNGTFNFSVHVSDGSGNSTNQSLSLIINSPIPVLSNSVPVLSVPVQTSGGQFQLTLGGNAGNSYTIEFSTNLINWVPLLITNPPNAQPLYLNFQTSNKDGFYQAYESGVAVSQSDFSFGTGVVGTPVIYVNVTNGTAVIPITRTNGLSTSSCVNYSTSGGTAVGGCDYTPTFGTLCFAAGVSSNSISIPVSLGCNTNQSATVNLQLSNTNGSNALNTVLIIQRPPPILAVYPASLTLDVPGNCGQSITISNAGPQGSVLNYTVADDGAFAGYLNLNGGGSFASGSLHAGQTAQVTFTVLDQFAFNWIGGDLTTAADIYTPGAANYVKYPISVTISPDGTKPQTEVLGTWSGTWSGTNTPGSGFYSYNSYEAPVSGTWSVNLQSVDPIHNTASGTLVWQGTDGYWTYETYTNGPNVLQDYNGESYSFPVNQTVTFPSDETSFGGNQSLSFLYAGCGQFRLSMPFFTSIDGYYYSVYLQVNLDVNTKTSSANFNGWDSQIYLLNENEAGDGNGLSIGSLTGSQTSP
jgi:hypothetical protein